MKVNIKNDKEGCIMGDLFSNFVLEELNDNSSCDIQGVNDVEHDIAVIGMSVKLPMADDLSEFWDICSSGRDCITEFPASRQKDINAYLDYIDSPLKNYSYVKGAFLEEIDSFDHLFFKMNPKEASLMNPAQRIFLERTWEAIENAGYGGQKMCGTKTGVFVGYIGDLEGYKYKQMINDLEGGFNPISGPGNLSSIIPSRISYLLDLRGPSMLIDTACSSSLVAVHTACESIRSGKCEMAIAGGVKINFFPLATDERIGIESSDGKTRSFDDESDGTGIGEGVGVVLLKPLRKALRDGDNIHAVIKGSAINQDGNSAGITAPKASAQTDLILDAWMDAGIDPREIGYLEAHGTGTKLGDPIEIQGITDAFRRYTLNKQFCAIGSVKSNMGHLYEAAGVIGMIKCILAMKNRQLPPSIHFMKPNKEIQFEQSPVYLNNMLVDWHEERYIRRSGVSSFGFSGTNCHIVLEEAPTSIACKENISSYNILTLSAKSKLALNKLVKRYRQFVAMNLHAEIQDLCFTANTGRGHYQYRLALLIDNMEDLLEKLVFLEQTEECNWKGTKIYYSRDAVSSEEHQPFNGVVKPNQSRVFIDGDFSSRTNQYEESPISLEDMSEICMLYTEGADIDWNLLYSEEKRKRIELPTYPFDKIRCWSEVPTTVEVQLTGRKSEKYSEIELITGRIWAETLAFKTINVNSSLYSLGVDSIAMLKITNRISSEFGISISVNMLFNNPTIEQISRVIQSILNEDSIECKIRKTVEQDYYEASSAQKRMYSMQQLNSESTAYNVTGAVELDGILNMEKLNKTFCTLIERHEALRTTFDMIQGHLVQIVHEPESVSFEVDEFEIQSEKEIMDIVHLFVKPFQLHKAPLFRVAYLKLPSKKSILLLDCHHIISDGSSMAILTQELGDLYSGYSLKPLELQYKDYTAWHLTKQTSATYKKQEKYWLSEFSEKPPLLNLYPDFKRPLVKDYKGESFQFKLDRDLTNRIKQIAQEEDCTVFMVLLASIKVLLAKQSGQEDLVIGTPIAGRNHPDIESIFGIMINTIAIRSNVRQEESFSQYLLQIREKTINAYENQDYQFEDLIENIQIERNLSVNPLFDVMFVLHEIPTIEIEGIKTQPYELPKKTEMFDLSFVATEEQDEIHFTLTYATSLFKAASIETMINKYKRMISIITKDTNVFLKDVKFVTEEEETLYGKNSGFEDVIESDFFF